VFCLPTNPKLNAYNSHHYIQWHCLAKGIYGINKLTMTMTYLDFVSCSSSGTSILTVLKTVSPKVADPSRRIWDNPILEESRGLYSRTRTLVTISGCGRVKRTKVSPLVDNGGHTGTRPELLSRDTSTATADGQAEKNLTLGMQYVTGNPTDKLHGLSPRANYTDRATAACQRSDCQLLRIEGATWSVWRIPTAVFSPIF
jgi:hypothetical protein